MNVRCSFESEDGRLCKRWAVRGSNFCFNHQPPSDPYTFTDGLNLHPLARLATPEDLFDVVRETLNAARQGRVTPGQAYAVGFLAQVFLKVREQVSVHQRHMALARQLIPTLSDEELAAEAAQELAMPLPVKVDEEASVAAPPPPRNAAEAEARMREALAKMPPLNLEPLSSYPGYNDTAAPHVAPPGRAASGKTNGSG